MKNLNRICLTLVTIFLSSTFLTADSIELKNGEVITGHFLSADQAFVKIKIGNLVRTFRTDKVSLIKFSPRPEAAATTPSAQPKSALKPKPPASPSPEAATTEQHAQAQPAAPTNVPAPAEAPQPRRVQEVIIPAGTFLAVRLIDSIDTDKNKVGDPFNASLDEPLVIGDETVAPKNTLVHGRIIESKESGKISGAPELRLELTDMILNNRQISIRTGDYQEIGQGRGTRSAEMIGGGAAVGALIGAIAGKGKGVAIGAASGAAAGTAVQVLTKGNQLKIPSETRLSFRLQDAVTIRPKKSE